MRKRRTSDGLPEIVSVVILGNRDETTVLGWVASLLSAAGHPLGVAIFNAVTDGQLQIGHTERLTIVAGKSVVGSIDGHAVVVGDSTFLSAHGLSLGDFETWDTRLAQQGQSVILAAIDGELAAFLSVLASKPQVSCSRKGQP
jgi:Cu+-exporting ATPase